MWSKMHKTGPCLSRGWSAQPEPEVTTVSASLTSVLWKEKDPLCLVPQAAIDGPHSLAQKPTFRDSQRPNGRGRSFEVISLG